MIDLLPDAVCMVDPQGRFLFVSPAGEQVFGYRPSEMCGRYMTDFLLPEDRPVTLAAAAEIMAGHPQQHFQNRYRRKDGSVAHLSWSARWSPEHRVRIAVARDITELKQAEARQSALLAVSQAAFNARDAASLVSQVQQMVGSWLPDVELYVLAEDSSPGSAHLSPGWLGAVGAASELAATLAQRIMSTAQLLEPADLPLPECADAWLGLPLGEGPGCTGAVLWRRTQGGLPVQDRSTLECMSMQLAIALDRLQHTARLAHQAQHDPLTHLANRDLLRDRLLEAERRARGEGRHFGVLYIDLDRFKAVNDHHGHSAGDLVLRAVADRMRGLVRSGDTVARLGGDEFAVLLVDVQQLEQLRAIAQRFRAVLAAPIADATLSSPISVSASLGMAWYPEHGDSVDALLQRSDLAMYRAKSRGGDAVQEAMQRRA